MLHDATANYLVLPGGKGSFLTLVLEVNVHVPFGKPRETIGVNSFRSEVTEIVTVSPGPPALPLPPLKLEI
jgi:hypothetical protein